MKGGNTRYRDTLINHAITFIALPNPLSYRHISQLQTEWDEPQIPVGRRGKIHNFYGSYQYLPSIEAWWQLIC